MDVGCDDVEVLKGECYPSTALLSSRPGLLDELRAPYNIVRLNSIPVKQEQEASGSNNDDTAVISVIDQVQLK